MSAFGDFYRGKTVLVTGHTGFKGSWLSIWLTRLGAKVVGYALAPPTEPSNFVASRLTERIDSVLGDVRDFEHLERILRKYQPHVVFHLAAQALVRRSFAEPRETFEVNVMGSVNTLEAARRAPSVGAIVSITSDKCYRNQGWAWGYRETDELGGFDPYSASKAAAEIAIGCFQDSRFQAAGEQPRDVPIAAVRAGNVIGGGDWASDRLVPDVVRALAKGADLVVRNPDATRPWQHVLEPLSGYLWLAARLSEDRSLRSAWNFGPEDRPLTVAEIAAGLLSRWPSSRTRLVIEREDSQKESLLLRLDCSKAWHFLGWRATWTIDETLDAIAGWYRQFYEHPDSDLYASSVEQIDRYTAAAKSRGLAWSGAHGARP